MTESIPTAGTTPAPAPAASPVAERSGPTHHVTQHLLAADGPTKVMLSTGSRLLDVHMIDGRYYVRTVEPIEVDEADTVEIVPAALGSRLSLDGMMPLVVRAGGIHFFTTAYEV